jgi:hypothetical protein
MHIKHVAELWGARPMGFWPISNTPIPLWFCMRWRPDVPGLIGLLSSIRPGHSNADFSEILPVLYFYGDPRLSNYTLILHMVQFLLTNSYGSRVFVYQFMS